MSLTLPNFLQAGSYGAGAFSQYFQALLAGGGVVGSGDLAVTQNGTPNMSVNVAQGQVLMPGSLGVTGGFPTNANAQTGYGLPASFTSQGTYESYNNASVNLPLAAADPTNPRIDLICASTQDAQWSGSTNQGVLQVITGTPAPSPSPPSAPANTVVLAYVNVPANASSIVTADITDERPILRLLGDVPAHTRVFLAGSWTTSTSVFLFTYDTVNWDAMNCWSAGSHTFTCPTAGWYRVTAQIVATSTATSQWLAAFIFKNGSEFSGGAIPYSSATSQNLFGLATDTLECAAGDVLTIHGQCSTNGLTGSTGSAVVYAAFDFIGR